MFIERKTEQSDEAAVTAVFGVQGGRDLGGKSLMSKKYLYYFSEGNDAFGGDKVTMKNVLGGKGAGLAEMTAAGMPVPQGFTITTEACTQYYADGRQINDEITADIFEHVKGLEEITGKKFGDNANPLLVSVRSGARQSMPGMMDTILNLGLNDEAVEGLAKKTGNARFAYDCYRRFVQMFADVVMMVPKSLFEVEIDKMKEAKGISNDVDLTADDLKELVAIFKKIYEDNEGKPFPQDPREQLIEAVKAVFRSWDNPRANVYRKMNEIPYEWGTAVNVQQMAFGNSGDRSGTGVAFTRDPATGAKKLMGEYLINAQGEDVVAGVRTPSPISHLHEQMPEVYDQFIEIANRLENYFRDMQDMEFTIEDGHLYMLQTRNGKRTAQAALQIACDLVDEGMITEREAVLRVEPKQLDSLLHPQFDPDALKKAEVIGKGLAASPGAACGKVVFTAEDAKEWHARGEKVVLVRLETSPEDIEGMQVAQGILTVRGGMTSHAAVVARGMGTCCVSGCGDIVVDYAGKKFSLGGKDYHEGDYISIDGSTGNIYGEAIPTVPADVASGNFGRFMGWADKYRQLQVYTNADTPRDAKQARAFGAEGIGLTRTEHMFFEESRIKAMRDVTRGGLATVLHEFAVSSDCCVELEENRLPVSAPVKGFCGLLGLDPLYMGNEGKMTAVVAGEDAPLALECMKKSRYGENAAIIGHISQKEKGKILLTTPIGGTRILSELIGEGLPRIC